MLTLDSLFNQQLSTDAYWLAKQVPNLRSLAESRGFAYFYLDGQSIHDEQSFYNIISVTLPLPTEFGRNLDALPDALGDMTVNGPVLIVFEFYELLASKFPRVFMSIVAIFRRTFEDAEPRTYFLFVGQPDLLPEKLEVIDPT